MTYTPEAREHLGPHHVARRTDLPPLSALVIRRPNLQACLHKSSNLCQTVTPSCIELDTAPSIGRCFTEAPCCASLAYCQHRTIIARRGMREHVLNIVPGQSKVLILVHLQSLGQWLVVQWKLRWLTSADAQAGVPMASCAPRRRAGDRRTHFDLRVLSHEASVPVISAMTETGPRGTCEPQP
jgi:hypothetical protein